VGDCSMSFREQKAKSPIQMLSSVPAISSGRSELCNPPRLQR
jgi:hypothetical protein